MFLTIELAPQHPYLVVVVVVCVRALACIYIHVWRSEDNQRTWVFLSTIWILGFKARSSGLGANAFNW